LTPESEEAVLASLHDPATADGGPEARALPDVRSILDEGGFQTVFQPIFELESRAVVGFEALTRFDAGAPEVVFAAAQAQGVRAELEELTMTGAFRAAGSLPAAALLHVNVSSDVIRAHEPLATLLAEHGWLVVLELTEDVAVGDYRSFRAGIDRLGPDVMLAVDDAGAGFASLRHILELRPQFVKLDGSIVRGIGASPAKQALVAGLSYFAIRTGSVLIAESIESASAVRTLLDLGVSLGQGYYLGRPVPAGDLARTPPAPIDWPSREAAPRGEPSKTTARDVPVERALNIGGTLARALRDTGIRTFGDLVDTGSVAAWRRLRARQPKLATPATLLALEAAIQTVRPSMLSSRERGTLGVIARVEGRREPPTRS
jgi:EAL domain-containing protein (putative c-di-GMP-specific phosphodiesterase class I)